MAVKYMLMMIVLVSGSKTSIL